MTVLEYIIGGLLLVLAGALIALIGLQQSKRKSGLGSIAGNGASDSYLTRNKIASKESTYKKITLILAIVFIVLVLALYIIGSIDTTDDTSATSSVAASTATSSVAAESSTVAESSVSAESSVAAESSEVVSE